MTPVHAVIVIGGSVLILTASIAMMHWANQSERRVMERRRAEWIAGGRVPEEEPNFYTGSGGSGN
jgi:heme O synthase-like polyprenyltransferase